jgi:hypothetical protein
MGIRHHEQGMVFQVSRFFFYITKGYTRMLIIYVYVKYKDRILCVRVKNKPCVVYTVTPVQFLGNVLVVAKQYPAHLLANNARFAACERSFLSNHPCRSNLSPVVGVRLNQGGLTDLRSSPLELQFARLGGAVRRPACVFWSFKPPAGWNTSGCLTRNSERA